MHIALIAFHFPPDPAVGSIRPHRLAMTLAARGHTVSVITRSGLEISEEESTGIEILPVQAKMGLRDLWRRVRPFPQAGVITESPSHSEASWAAPTHVSYLRRLAYSMLWLPDDQQGFAIAAARRAIDLLRRGADLLYSTSPPHSSQVAGLIAATATGAPWISEFRDPWGETESHPGKPAFIRSALSDTIEERLEYSCLRRADRVVAVSHGIARTISEACPGVRPNVFLNGIAKFAGPVAPTRTDGFVHMIHAGTLYHGRDPLPLFAGLAGLREEAPELADRVKVRFVGNCQWFQGKSVQEMIDRLGLSKVVTLTDWVEPRECQRLIEEADFQIVLAQRQPIQVPNKLYDCLGSLRPILAFADADGETAKMLTALGEHYVVTSDSPAHITGVLRQALERHALDAKPLEITPQLEQWTARKQFAGLCDLIEQFA